MTRIHGPPWRRTWNASPPPTLYPHALAVLTHLALEPAAGERYLALADWLRDFAAWSDQQRAAWQRARLADVLRHAREEVPFYRDCLGVRGPPEDISLLDLPIVDKARIRADTDAFLSRSWRDMPYLCKKTGGSTGDPWRYPLDRRAWAHQYAAAIHLRERVGYRYGEPVVLLGAPVSLGLEGQSWKSRLRHRLERHNQELTGFKVDHAASVERVKRADAAGAALWYGYASTIAAMANAALREGIAVVGPRAVITTAEVLQPAWRDRIERAFGPRLFDEYGCNDGGVLAQTCAVGRFHVAENVSVVEILHGDRPCPAGVEGDVTVTNLHARVLPFVRYKTGDRAVLGNDQCPCGVLGQTLERVSGRTGDHVKLPDGTELSTRAFAHVFKETPDVKAWQVVQAALHDVRVRLEVDPGFDVVQTELIEGYVGRHCGPDVRVSLTTNESIDRTPGGKYRVVVREFEDS